MREFFLSASIPLPDCADFHQTANPFLIQFAVRELLTVCLGRRLIVWGGHPAITPMIWAVCEDMGVEYEKTILLYQSTLFKNFFPEENKRFSNVVYVDAVDADQSKSLDRMRVEMLSRPLEAAVFIGGMEGVLEEHQMFRRIHPNAKVLAVSSPGGAGKELANQLGQSSDRIDFARMFYTELGVDVIERRDQVQQKAIVAGNFPPEEWAAALNNIGAALNKLERGEEAVAAYDQLLERFGDTTEPTLCKLITKAYNNKGVVLYTLGRNEEAINAYDQVLQQFSGSIDPILGEQLAAKVLNNKGMALYTLGRNEEAISTYDQLLQQFGDNSDPALSEQVAKALNNKGFILYTLGHYEQAIDVYDQLLQQFGDNSDPAINEQVAKACKNKEDALDRGEVARGRTTRTLGYNNVQKFNRF